MATDHLAKAKDYIAKGDDYHRKAADEMIAARDDDPMLTYKEIGERVGRSESWCHRLVQKRTELSDPKEPFFGGDDENAARYERHVKQVLRDPSRRKRAISELSSEERADVRREVDDQLREREQVHVEPPRADWSTITTRLYSARRSFEESLSELKSLGRENLSDEAARDLLDTVERTVGAGELLAAFLRGSDMLSEIEDFLAEQVR